MTFSTTVEALEWLKAETGEQLSESSLLDLAAGCGVVLHAAPPLDRKAELMTFDPAGVANGTNPRGFKTKFSIGWKMVQLFPFHIGQILTIGETESIHAAGQLDTSKEEYYLFPEPVRVTRDQVRVSRVALLELTERVKNIQARTNAEQQPAASSGAPEIDEPPTPVETTSEKPTDGPKWYDIEQETGCRRMILENWNTIALTCGNAANGGQVLRQLKIAYGKEAKLPELKTVQNRLTELRKEKLIP